jgi:hypothetical protein
MKRTSCHIASRALLGILLLAVAVPTAWAQVPGITDLDHFRCYIVSQQTPQPATTVTLSDQFRSDVTLTVNEPLQFCAPTDRDGNGILHPEAHLTMYGAAANLVPHLRIDSNDRIGNRMLDAVGARFLLAPTQKTAVNGEPTGLLPPVEMNHFWCYEVDGEPVNDDVVLEDQFRDDMVVRVTRPKLFCNPVAKTVGGVVTPIFDAEEHLTCFEIHAPQRTQATEVDIVNQFETDTMTITAFELLCVPSTKFSFAPVP